MSPTNKRFINENSLLAIGPVLVTVWSLVILIALNLESKDARFILLIAGGCGIPYGLILIGLGIKDYLWWKRTGR